MVDRDGGPLLSASNFTELAPEAWKILLILIADDINGAHFHRYESSDLKKDQTTVALT